MMLLLCCHFCGAGFQPALFFCAAMLYNVPMCTTDKTRGVFAATVLENRPLCDEHYLIRLQTPGFPATEAGQFVQLQCRPNAIPDAIRVVDWTDDAPPKLTGGEIADGEPLLRRPLSLAGRDGDILDIIYRVVGRGTGWLQRAAAGTELTILGPLGAPFPIPDTISQAILVGGGVGIPPMLYLAKALNAAGVQTTAICGARTAGLMPLATDDSGQSVEFSARGAHSILCTDDGTLGRGGLVTEPLAELLAAADDPAAVAVYSCGPEIMMKYVGLATTDAGAQCFLSLERSMACGMGTCQGCIVKIKDDSERGWNYKLCCSDGPVFPAESILWE
jgi:dihydroorotate dehydrogenase electron transfer subunit